jgi:hypothetical protein
MIVYDGITAERDVPQRAWRPTSRCRSSAGVQRTASAQDGDAARFICGTAHTIWGGKSLRWDPPARRNRLHPQRYTVVRPTSLGSVGHRHFFADALSLRAGICRLARARLGQPAASYGTPWVDHIPPPPTATKGAPGSASDQFVHRRQHGEFFEHWWGNYLTRDSSVPTRRPAFIQVRRRLQPTLPPGPNQAARVQHEYDRQGALQYVAA